MKKVLIFLLIIATFITGAIYSLPGSLKAVSEKELSEILQTEVSIKNIETSILRGSFSVNELKIKDYPELSEDNVFVLKDLVFIVEPASLFHNNIVIKELTIAGMQINLTGSINNNSLLKIKNILDENNRKEIAEEEFHKKTANVLDGEHEHHEHNELKLKIANLNINDILVSATITEPVKLETKEIKFKGLNLQDVGGEDGLDVNNTLKDIITSISSEVKFKIGEQIPAQKIYEDAKDALDEGINSLKTKFNDWNN